ncbi:MAG TPA: mycothiol conjugate amidase Mca, partial [Lapillicoccus sp.]|nr:mycothiol conjugate amidase Mca [Lapillicoccus sp.]
SMSAFAAAGDPDAYPQAGEPWQPLKLYYLRTTTKARIQRLYDLMVERGVETDYGDWLKEWKKPDIEVTTRIQCAEYFDLRDRALLAHATQVDPDGAWFHTPRDIVREGWPTEEYELVVSYAPVQLPEDDLFAGIGSLEEADALARKAGIEPVRDTRPDPQLAVDLLRSTSG